jgi:hypothetical protein
MLVLLLACASPSELAALTERVAHLESALAESEARIAALEAERAGHDTTTDIRIEPTETADCGAPGPITLRDFRMVPHKGATGEVDGYRVFGIRRGTWIDCGGLKNGDVLLRVDGAPATNPEKVFDALGRDPSSWRIEGVRRGAPFTLPAPAAPAE